MEVNATSTTGAREDARARRPLAELGEREFLDDLVRGDARTARKRGRKARILRMRTREGDWRGGARGGRARRDDEERRGARGLTTTRSTVMGRSNGRYMMLRKDPAVAREVSRGRGWATTRGANLVGAANRRDFGGARGALDAERERRGRAIERLTTTTTTTTLDRESQTTRSSRSAR